MRSASLQLTVHNLFTCCVSMHGRCRVWPWFSEFSGVALGCFHAFSLAYCHGGLAQPTGRLVQPIAQGKCLFSVMGQLKRVVHSGAIAQLVERPTG